MHKIRRNHEFEVGEIERKKCKRIGAFFYPDQFNENRLAYYFNTVEWKITPSIGSSLKYEKMSRFLLTIIPLADKIQSLDFLGHAAKQDNAYCPRKLFVFADFILTIEMHACFDSQTQKSIFDFDIYWGINILIKQIKKLISILKRPPA